MQTRLDIAVRDGEPLFSWPGENSFRQAEGFEAAGTDMGFGTYPGLPYAVFLPEDVSFEYEGDESLDGATRAKFRFEAPQACTVRFGNRRAQALCRGAFWVDPATDELVALELNADDLPEPYPLSEVKTVVRYARVRLGNADYPLPVSVLRTAVRPADSTLVTERIELRNHRPCAPPPQPARSLAPGLRLKVALDIELDVKALEAGALVGATLARPIESAGKGAKLRGVLVRKEYFNPGTLLEFRFQFEDKRLPFDAALESLDWTLPGIRAYGRNEKSTLVRLFVEDGIRVPAGFTFVLKTVAD